MSTDLLTRRVEMAFRAEDLRQRKLAEDDLRVVETIDFEAPDSGDAA